MNTLTAARPIRTIGRYALFDEIAAGGMATVHLGRLIGPVGFSRTVAIKRLHSHFAKDPEFSAGFVDEARLAARIHHPNVVPIIDVLAEDSELSLVMDYVEGESLARLLRQSGALAHRIPLPIVSSIVCGTLYGLHAAHEAVNERGKPMHIVHRDVSPQNVLVGLDGVARLVDFGVAKAAQRLQTTAEGQVKGKVAYMAPEQIRQDEVTRRTDIYAAGVVLWELISGRRLFQSENPAHMMNLILEGEVPPPSAERAECPSEVDRIALRALSRDPKDRYPTARAMAQELQVAIAPAPPTEVGDWLQSLANEALTERRKIRAEVESQEVTEDSSRAFIARPHNEDLATVADHPSTRPPGPTMNPQPRERVRMFLPLVLGLLLVTGTIVLVVSLNTPQLQISPHDDQRPTLDDRAPHLSQVPVSEPREPAPEVVSPEQEDDSHPTEIESVPETNTTTPVPAVPAPKLFPKPASCPKFYVDEDGIRRVNRECWK